MEVRLLGPIAIGDGAGGWEVVPGAKLRGLLAVLALDAGATVSARRLADSVWSADAAPRPSVLQVALSKLRGVLAGLDEPDRIVNRPPGYVLQLERTAVDVLRFEALIDAARQRRPQWPLVADLLRQALALWTGEPLGGAPDTDALVAERVRLEELHRTACDDLADARLALGEHAQLVGELEALVAEEPLRERRWGLLLRALYGSGRQAEALRAYHRARQQLVEEIGVEPGAELRHLHDAVLAHDDAVLGSPFAGGGGPVAVAFRRQGNLRHPVEPCIGRDREIELVAGLLAQRRLVTLVGPGGVGKTRLALEAAATRQDHAPDGVWWVDLAAAETGADALGAVLRVLGLEGSGRDGPAAIDAVVAVLTERTVLLVLDNCEHLVAGLAAAVGELLARCPHLRVLATSREPLRVDGERLVEIEPLALDAAVELFQRRVAAPIDGDAATVAVIETICEQLDRLPLGVELAAARTRHLRLDEIAERLAVRFEVLRDDARAAAPRQQSLDAVAAWSYGLLTVPEQLVFERLSVFADGATLAAAGAVCSRVDVPAGDVEGLLYRLVDRSLVVADRSGMVTRFRMLRTLGDFAAGRLAARGDRDDVAHAHARWVRDLARTVAWGARTSGPTVAAVQAETVAIADAVGWCTTGDPVLGLEICDDLAPFWFGSMRVATGWELLGQALDAAGGMDPARRSSALAWAVVFASSTPDGAAVADALTDEAWRFEVDHGSPARLGRLCVARALAGGYRSGGDAQRWVDEARAHLAAADAPVGAGYVLLAEGAARVVTGDDRGAAASLSAAIDELRRAEDHLGQVRAVSRLGELAWRVDDLELFAAMHTELLELGLAGRLADVIAGATARLALARLRAGEVETARRMASAALASASDSLVPVVNGFAFRTAGLVDLHLGHVAEGRAELVQAIEHFAHGAGNIGIGYAATCWIDLSRSYSDGDEIEAAVHAADVAVSLAAAVDDPWVLDQAEANRTAVTAAAA